MLPPGISVSYFKVGEDSERSCGSATLVALEHHVGIFPPRLSRRTRLSAHEIADQA